MTAPAPSASLGRDRWTDLLARLTVAFADAAEAGGSPARARLPGAPPGDVVPSLEGFARMSVAWGAWLGLASNPPTLARAGRVVDVGRLVAQGLVDGTTDGPFGWGPIGDRDQRIVEAAELATGLWLGRQRLVPLLGRAGLAIVLRWLSRVDGRAVYDDNWHLFPAIVATVRRGLGESVPDASIDAGLDRMQAWYRDDGWYTDGPGRAHDSYTGWAIHWHQLLWAAIDGARRPRLRRAVVDRARAFLRAGVTLVAADGSRPLQGRSLGYRFADAAPYALAELLGHRFVAPGLARRLAEARIRHHLEAGALDPASGWFRRGVAAERPAVLERYVSAGAVAWAAHTLVALGVPADAPFWAAPDEPLPVDRGDGSLALPGPGFLVAWRHATGEVALHSALAHHPPDIPGHDYGAYYGKLAYRSHFPASIRAAGGDPTPDDAILVEATGDDGRPIRAIRGEPETGGVGPTWAWSRYRVDAGGRHRLTTAVPPWRKVGGRATGVEPAGPIRLVEAPAALPARAAGQVERFGSPAARWQAARAPGRLVAIAALAGYDEVVASGPAGAGPDLNLVAPHAETPAAVETSPSPRRRIVAAVVCAVADPDVPLDELGAVSLAERAAGLVDVRLGEDELAIVALRRPIARHLAAGRVVEGRLRVLRWRRDATSFAGEAIGRIDGVARLDAAGPFGVTRRPDGTVEVTCLDGFELDPAWAGRPRSVEVLDVLDWRPASPPDRVVGVSRREIRRLQRRLGRRLLTLRLRP